MIGRNKVEEEEEYEINIEKDGKEGGMNLSN